MFNYEILYRAKTIAEKQYLKQRAGVLGLSVLDAGARVYENIMGVGIGEKRVNRQGQGYPSVKFYVKKKLYNCPSEYCIEPEILGVETDVEQIGVVSIGEPIPERLTQMRPAPGGVSIGHYQITAGTLGCWVADSYGRYYILSNNHVLANMNKGVKGYDPILQPAPYDGGQLDRDTMGFLSDYVPINVHGKNVVDAAIAVPLNEKYIDLSILGIGNITGKTSPELGAHVRKSGRTTKVTEGIIDSISTTINVKMSGHIIQFTDQVIIRGENDHFSLPGDSGSVVVDDENNVCALLFAGSQTEWFSVGNDIQNVEEVLGIRVA